MRPVRAYPSKTQKKSPIRVAFCILERAICGEDSNGTFVYCCEAMIVSQYFFNAGISSVMISQVVSGSTVP